MTFAIYDAVSETILNVEEIKIPAAFDIPDALKYMRNNLLDVMREYKVDRAGVRITEPNAQNPSFERIQMEGVIQEAFASSDLKSYYVGQISSISARLKIERAKFKPIVEGENALGVDNWNEMSKWDREAILCAIGAVNA